MYSNKIFVYSIIIIFLITFIGKPALLAEEYEFVSTKDGLKKAIENKVSTIYITDKTLSNNCKKIETASDIAIGVAILAIVTGTIAITNSWNPVGWGSYCFAAPSAICTSALIVVILAIGGVMVVQAIRGEYKYLEVGANVSGIHVYAKLSK